MLAFTPSTAFAPNEVQFNYACANEQKGAGVNTLILSGSTTPVPDIIAVNGTSVPGYVELSPVTNVGAFVVATANVGASGTITASANAGMSNLPLTLRICRTNALTGVCLAPPGSSVALPINEGDTRTFAVFVASTTAVPDMPAANRIFVTFTDADEVLRGKTSVAVRTPLEAAATMTRASYSNPVKRLLGAKPRRRFTRQPPRPQNRRPANQARARRRRRPRPLTSTHHRRPPTTSGAYSGLEQDNICAVLLKRSKSSASQSELHRHHFVVRRQEAVTRKTPTSLIPEFLRRSGGSPVTWRHPHNAIPSSLSYQDYKCPCFPSGEYLSGKNNQKQAGQHNCCDKHQAAIKP